jgi:hypothetical protein
MEKGEVRCAREDGFCDGTTIKLGYVYDILFFIIEELGVKRNRMRMATVITKTEKYSCMNIDMQDQGLIVFCIGVREKELKGNTFIFHFSFFFNTFLNSNVSWSALLFSFFGNYCLSSDTSNHTDWTFSIFTNFIIIFACCLCGLKLKTQVYFIFFWIFG